MRKLTIIILVAFFGLNMAIAQTSENTAPFRFDKKEVKGFMKLKTEQIKKSAYNKGLSLCKKYNFKSDNDIVVGQSLDGEILYRFISSSGEETAVITDSTGKMVEVISYLNEEYKPYSTILDILAQKEYTVYSNNDEYGSAVKFITRKDTWIEVLAKRTSEEKSPILVLFFSDNLKFLREEEKE